MDQDEDFYAASFASESAKPPRVEILRGSGSNYFKKGQFGYVVGVNAAGGQHYVDRDEPSAPGEIAFLVSKTPDMKGGALWFSAPALRFTKVPKSLLNELLDAERVALDLFLANGNGAHKKEIAELVPNMKRRGFVKMIASQMKSLRAR